MSFADFKTKYLYCQEEQGVQWIFRPSVWANPLKSKTKSDDEVSVRGTLDYWEKWQRQCTKATFVQLSNATEFRSGTGLNFPQPLRGWGKGNECSTETKLFRECGIKIDQHVIMNSVKGLCTLSMCGQVVTAHSKRGLQADALSLNVNMKINLLLQGHCPSRVNSTAGTRRGHRLCSICVLSEQKPLTQHFKTKHFKIYSSSPKLLQEVYFSATFSFSLPTLITFLVFKPIILPQH